jgi:hypothetical protein
MVERHSWHTSQQRTDPKCRGLEAICSVGMLSSLLIAVAILGITTLGVTTIGITTLPWEYWIYPLRVAHQVSIAARFSLRYTLIL